MAMVSTVTTARDSVRIYKAMRSAGLADEWKSIDYKDLPLLELGPTRFAAALESLHRCGFIELGTLVRDGQVMRLGARG
jgi:hypothetical protein